MGEGVRGLGWGQKLPAYFQLPFFKAAAGDKKDMAVFLTVFPHLFGYFNVLFAVVEDE